MLELETDTALEERLLTEDLALDSDELVVIAEELLTTTGKLLAEDRLLAGGIMIRLDAELELGAASDAATSELDAISLELLDSASSGNDDETTATLELLGISEGALLTATCELLEDWTATFDEETTGVLLTGADLLPPPPPHALSANASAATDTALREYILMLSMIVLLV